MSESKGGSSERSEPGARKPPTGRRSHAGGPGKATGSPHNHAGGPRSKATGSPRKAGSGARKPKAGPRTTAAGGGASEVSVTTGAVKTTTRRSTTKKGAAGKKIVPIYARLPRGPHPLGAPGVARNQRIRIHGGMIEAIATRGYPQTSVKLVVGLAGVSRRAFYEQFSGKEECFMATFDLIVNRIVQRLTQVYRGTRGGQRERLRAALRVWGDELEQNPKALRLAIAEAEASGTEGLRRLQRVTALCEGLLASAFSGRCPSAAAESGAEGSTGAPVGAERASGVSANGRMGGGGDEADGGGQHTNGVSTNGRASAALEADRAGGLPLPVVRAIVGGLRRATQMRLLDDDTDDLSVFTGEMLKWTLLFNAPAARRLRPRPCANEPFPDVLALEPEGCGGEERRARLLRSAIELGLREEKLESLTSVQISDAAGLSFEAVTELFADPIACYMEALDVLGDELLQLVASPDLVSAEWPAAVCRTVAELLAHLAGSPARLMTLASKALDGGPAAVANVRDLAYETATLLTEGAPRRPRTRIAVEGIAGGLWQILYCEAHAGRGHRLPLLSEYVAYVVLAPYLGPEAAVEAIVRSRPHASGATNGVAPLNGVVPVAQPEGEAYLRLAERRSAKCVSTTPTSTDTTITTINGA
jgi:AcrR family transcriptional regulator